MESRRASLASSSRNAVKVYAARIVLLIFVAVAACGLGVLLFTVSLTAVLLIVGAVTMLLLGGRTLSSEQGHPEHRRRSSPRELAPAWIAAIGMLIAATTVAGLYVGRASDRRPSL